MRRYAHILGVCWRAAVATELEYRANFLTGAVLSLFWMSWASVGVAVADPATHDPDQLLRIADLAMYEVKDRTRSRTAVSISVRVFEVLFS